MALRALLFLLLTVAGCGGRGEPPNAADRRDVVDDLGRTLSVAVRPERIVSLAPSVTELAVAAGSGTRLVGVTDADDWPPSVTGLPRIQALPVDHEAVVRLEPDLVLASDDVNDPRDAETLAALGIPTFFVSVESLGDVVASIESLGELFGTSGVAARAADSLRSAGRSLEERSLAREVRPGVLVLIGDRTLFAFGAGSYAHDLVALAGGRSVTESLETRAPVLSDEFVLQEAPDVIIGAFGDDYDPSELLSRHPTWASLPAARSGRIHSIDPDLLLRPGPRLFQGALRMAELIETGSPNR